MIKKESISKVIKKKENRSMFLNFVMLKQHDSFKRILKKIANAELNSLFSVALLSTLLTRKTQLLILSDF